MPTTITKTITLYTFEELSPEAQQKALEHLCDLNVDYDWWEYIYDDAASIGLRIDEFDIYRNTISGCLTEDPENVIAAILEEHGEDCKTCKTAKDYQGQYNTTLAAHVAVDPENNDERSLRDTQWYDEFHSELCHALKEDYLVMLRHEYEYQTSDEQIKESITANEYKFDEDGALCYG